MVKDNQELVASGAPQPAETCQHQRGFKLTTVLIALALVYAASGYLFARWVQEPQVRQVSGGGNPTSIASTPVPKRPLFKDWPNPDFVLVLTAQQFGHLQECGCSDPQRGGLVRRYNLIQNLKKRGWKVVALDLGDISQRHGPQSLPNIQGLIKYRYSMMALKAMDYCAVGIGANEMQLPLFPAIGEYALQHARPRLLAANLLSKDNDFPGDANDYKDRQPSLIGNWHVEPVKLADKEFKVGIIGVVGPTVADKARNQNLKFAENKTVIPAVLKDLEDKGKPDFRVLLYQGVAGDRPGKKLEAQLCAEQHPQFQIVVGLSEEDEYSRPVKVGNTHIVNVGQKGKYVCVVGIKRTDNLQQPYDIRIEHVPLDPEWETPLAEEQNHPIMNLMEEYTKEIKDQNYISKYVLGKHPVQVVFPNAKYVGAAACQKCHGAETGVWEDVDGIKEGRKLAHSRAYASLVKAKKPSLRQFDAECVVCHTTGFGYQTGYNGDATKVHLLNVTCESCHGPASEHVADPNNQAKREALNPWKRQPNEPDDTKRIARIDQFCQKCHDLENDVHWKQLKEKWENGIDHCFRNPIVFPSKTPTQR